MSTVSKLFILCVTLSIVAVQVHAFPNAAAQPTGTTTVAPSGSLNTGSVVETMNASGYTYVLIENNGQQQWAAVPATEVKVGDNISLAGGMVMPNFTSKSLGRTFDSIVFSQGLSKQ